MITQLIGNGELGAGNTDWRSCLVVSVVFFLPETTGLFWWLGAAAAVVQAVSEVRLLKGGMGGRWWLAPGTVGFLLGVF